MKKTLFAALFCIPLMCGAAMADNNDRADKAKAKMAELFGNDYVPTLTQTDPDFAAIRDNLIYGELYYQGSLNDTQRTLVTLAELIAGEQFDYLKQEIEAALNLKIAPDIIKEAIYQTAPYCGIGKAEKAINISNEVFTARGITLPLKSHATVNEENRFEKGRDVQVGMYGKRITDMHKATPDIQKYISVNHLSAYCFGDFFTRTGLSPKEREMLIFAVILTLGGAEGQLQGHALGNITAGNTKQNLIDIAALLMPYNGFPRTLNALNVINKAITDKK